MEILTARETGLFPAPDEIEMQCSCPDWATMCKHVAAVLYGIGARLDTRPELLFVLRGADQTELVVQAAAGSALVGVAGSAEAMDSQEMERVFGIEIDGEAGTVPVSKARAARRAHAAPETPSGGASSEGPKAAVSEAGRSGRCKAGTRAAASSAAGEVPGRRARPQEGFGKQEREENVPDPSADGPGRDVRSRAAERLDARLPLLRSHLANQGSVSNSEYRGLFSVSMAVAAWELGRLVTKGILIQRGKKRWSRYLAGARLPQA
jgi:hypothetical protein